MSQTPPRPLGTVTVAPLTEGLSRPRATGLHATITTPTPVGMARLGRYQIVTRIATGGMAEVYLAVHGELAGFRTPVVLKKVLPHLACNQQFIDMFLDEARIASLLDHPNVVRIIEVGRTGTEYFLVMELVQGKPLSALIRRAFERQQQLDHRLAAFVVSQAAAGLHHAHELTDLTGNLLGLVHRDVSPQNVLISFEGSVKVIDFGIARALGRITDTNSGSMKGKFGYMSPEQARGEAIDLRTDIFALGVVLWEAVCGRRLFHRENDLATMRALIYEQIPKPSSLVTVAPELEAVIMRALSRNPKFRFATAREMVAALEKYIVQAGGATASDLGALMKSYFAQDQAHWQQTVRTAINLPSEPDPAVTPATTAELGAAGSFSTGSVPVLGNTGTGTGPGTTGASRITGVVVGDGAPRPRKAFVLGAVGLAGAVAAAGVLLGLGMGRRPSSPATTPAPARAAAAPDVKNAPVAPVIVPTDPPAVPVPAAPAEVSPAEDDEAAAKKTLRRKKPALGGGRGAVSPPALNPGPQPVDRKVNPF